MSIIAPIPRDERRLMHKATHKTRDKNYARRLTVILMLHRGEQVSNVARILCCACSSVGRWISWFTQSGAEGLKSLATGRMQCRAEHPVFYEDEVDIHINPKIGADWQLRGQQKRVITPGQNEKYYLAGALHSVTGKVSYVGKSSTLFISLLKHLKAT